MCQSNSDKKKWKNKQAFFSKPFKLWWPHHVVSFFSLFLLRKGESREKWRETENEEIKTISQKTIFK